MISGQLFWLKEGTNKLGSDPVNEIILPKAKLPAQAGAFVLTNGAVRFETPLANTFFVEGRPVSSLGLKMDNDDKPTIITFGSVSFQIIKRGDKIGVRVKDKDNPARTNFRGLDYFPTDLKWHIEARFEPYNPPKKMPSVNILGMESGEDAPGAVAFEVEGKLYRLDAIKEKGEPKLFMIFSDNTSGKETIRVGKKLMALVDISTSILLTQTAMSSSTLIRPIVRHARSRIMRRVRCRRNKTSCRFESKQAKNTAATHRDLNLCATSNPRSL